MPFAVSAAVGDIVIQEVSFNPSDNSDTGLEYIVVKNKSPETISLTGWDLYPDGVGYFAFPNFSLASQGEVKINLRKSGTNDAANFYQESATANMGDSSGSIALFSGTTHNKDTIQAFVRYQKSGPSGSKAWETAAGGAGIWQKEDFVNIESLVAGQVIFLSNPDNFKSSAGWSIKTSTEESSSDQSSQSQESQTQAPSQSSSGSNSGGSDSSTYIPPENLPKIKADAGADKTVVAGANVEFRGQAFGLKDEPLDNARFLWTFGDGATKEGKNITHIYRYLGDYVVVLDITSGDYSASDRILVKATANQIFLSEIKPFFAKASEGAAGSESWIEFENKSKQEIDISGWQIKIAGKIFTFPKSSRILPGAYLVVPFEVSGLVLPPEKGVIEFLYSGGFKADVFNYDGILKSGQSFNRDGGLSFIGSETPGGKNSSVVNNFSTANKNLAPSIKEQKTEEQKVVPKDLSEKAIEQNNKINADVNAGAINLTNSNNHSKTYFIIAILGVIIFGVVAILFIRRQRSF